MTLERNIITRTSQFRQSTIGAMPIIICKYLNVNNKWNIFTFVCDILILVITRGTNREQLDSIAAILEYGKL